MSKRPSNLSAAWTAGRLAARRLVGRGDGTRDLALAEDLTSRLDEMKGLAMKLGQIVSYMDVPLPAEVQAKLAALQRGARGRPLDELRDVITRSLGRPVEEAFDEIESEPVAAASIGQVHRAAVDGMRVAVKVQYPGIEKTFTEDLGLVHRIAGLASLASAVDGKSLVGELAARLSQECDYDAEARHQFAFARAFADDDTIQIPAVLRDRSGPQVLTTEWADAEPLETFVGHATAAQRGAAAGAMIRFSYRSLLSFGMIQADPHPGNFAFDPSGRLVCFDFGCVRHVDDAMVAALRDLSRALLDDDPARGRDAATRLGVVGHRRFDHPHFFESMRHLYRPFLVDDFHFTSDYVREAMAFNGPQSPNARYMAMPPAYIWVARLQWGLWSVLTRMDARGTFRPQLEAALAEPLHRIV